MSRAHRPSIHRAALLSSLAATVTFVAIPAAMAGLVAVGAMNPGIALGFVGFVAVAVGPWVFLGAYLGTLLLALGMRTVGAPLGCPSLRVCQLMGLGLAASLTLLGGWLTSEVQGLWLLFTLPAGLVGGSVFSRSLRGAS